MTKTVGIGGVSRAGKTTLAVQLANQLQNTLLLSLDDFVLPSVQLPRINQTEDWEHPLSVDWNNLFSTISEGENNYDYILIEGILTFAHPTLNRILSGGIYLHLSKASYWFLRLQETRWGKEPKWYLDYVWEAHQVYGKPSPGISKWLELPEFHSAPPFDPALDFIGTI